MAFESIIDELTRLAALPQGDADVVYSGGTIDSEQNQTVGLENFYIPSQVGTSSAEHHHSESTLSEDTSDTGTITTAQENRLFESPLSLEDEQHSMIQHGIRHELSYDDPQNNAASTQATVDSGVDSVVPTEAGHEIFQTEDVICGVGLPNAPEAPEYIECVEDQATTEDHNVSTSSSVENHIEFSFPVHTIFVNDNGDIQCGVFPLSADSQTTEMHTAASADTFVHVNDDPRTHTMYVNDQGDIVCGQVQQMVDTTTGDFFAV